MADTKPFLHIAEIVSAEAQAYLRTLTDPALVPAFPEPAYKAGWAKLQAVIEADALNKAAPIVARYAPVLTERAIGGVPVIGVEPKGWTESQHIAVYTHGGAHTIQRAIHARARSDLRRRHRAAYRRGRLHARAAREVSGDHGPGRLVVAGLIGEGHGLADIVIYGVSSGGGLAASSILKMRDRGMGLPTAAVLVSPWADLTPAGDAETTLTHADSNYLYEKHSVKAAGAYADPPDQRHPYASPVYGDYAPGFPPTLIQGGTKEILLSDFIRLYQAIDMAGGMVKLDLYERMPRNHASRIPDAPESRIARRKIAEFVQLHDGARRPASEARRRLERAEAGRP